MVRINRWWLILWACAVNGDFPPNPQIDFATCRRAKPSFICNQDNVIPFEDADKLDRIVLDIRRVSNCLCHYCPEDSGVSIAVFLAQDLRNRTAISPSWSGNDLAEWIREKWKIGGCNDDIVIVLIAKQNISGFSVGATLQNILSRDIVNQIFEDCTIHFKFRYFTQGLESVINSIGDVLLKIQTQNAQPEQSQLGLSLGIVLGICVFIILILAAAIILWRQSQRRNRSCRKHKHKTLNNINAKKGLEYHPCKFNDLQIESPDEEDSDSDVLYESVANCKDCTPLRTKRQLSDVLEEPEDSYKDDSAINIARRCSNRSQEVTEL